MRESEGKGLMDKRKPRAGFSVSLKVALKLSVRLVSSPRPRCLPTTSYSLLSPRDRANSSSYTTKEYLSRGVFCHHGSFSQREPTLRCYCEVLLGNELRIANPCIETTYNMEYRAWCGSYSKTAQDVHSAFLSSFSEP